MATDRRKADPSPCQKRRLLVSPAPFPRGRQAPPAVCGHVPSPQTAGGACLPRGNGAGDTSRRRFWQGEGSAFRLSVAISPGSQQNQEKSKSRRVEKCETRQKKEKAKTYCGVRRLDAAFLTTAGC